MWIACGFRRWCIATLDFSSGFYRINNLLIARTSTKIAFDGTSDLIPCWMFVFIEKRFCTHQESRRTKSALRTTMCSETSLDWSEVSALSESFDRCNLLPFYLACKAKTRKSRFSIDEDSATTTRTQIAPSLHTEHTDFIPQNIQ
jgi:hypothetical protein